MKAKSQQREDTNIIYLEKVKMKIGYQTGSDFHVNIEANKDNVGKHEDIQQN